jgi:hypothetical protein
VINPTFLTDKQPTFSKSKEESSQTSNATFKEGAIANWLKEQQKKESKNYKLLKEVKEFIQHHNVTNKKAQWGQIRSMCSANLTDDTIYQALFSEIEINNHKEGFLLHGKAKDKWSSKLIEALKEKYKEDIDYHAFIKLLSIYAPKEDDKGDSHE